MLSGSIVAFEFAETTPTTMDENLSRGYIQLGKARTANDFRFTNGFSHLSPPIDKCNCIYFALVLAGVGFLLPYNSFIIAVDYFQARYPGTTIVFDMSLVYIVMAFFAVLANNVLVETLSLDTRITFGYLVSFITLFFVAVCEIWWEAFGASTSYTINLVAVAVVALGCTVQQSSFYGYTSMLPSRYTQAVMAGESAAGFLVSSNRIITKLLLDDQRVNTIIFFVMSVAIIALCFGLHQVVKRTDFVQFYITLCRESRKIVLEPTEDVGLMDTLDQNDTATKSQYGVLKLQQSPLATDSGTSSSDNNLGVGGSGSGAFSFCNPVYEPTGTGVGATAAVGGTTTYKVEDVVVRMRSTYSSHPSTGKAWGGLKRGLLARWEVAKTIWTYMLSIGLAYFVTLCLYPGIESEIVSCTLKSWMPVVLMAIFNAADLVGKVLASIPYDWSRTQLIVFAWVRTMLVPLLLLCTTPRGSPVISGEGYPMLFSLILGITNGLVGSVPMIQAPSRVSEEHRELTGNIMTLSYNIGLTAGSLVAYLLDAIIGPPLPGNGCKIHTHYQNRSRATLVSSVTKANHNITSTVPTTLLSSVAGATESSAANVSTLLLATITSTVIASVSQVVNMPTSESPVLNYGNVSTGFSTSLEPF
ncbi:equilibrative nucleoside transporter 4 [Schistocerca nitens]|uniref:equilibrative nucleoside transporter 4 n=1 Tax=Schistocerca nitens TaxID=7011 RepID=UPI0021179048|nr:equilibrative nucleoside transporter 4 [Schistocerca nitens]